MAREHETKAGSYLVTWTVEPGEAGMRLDLFLKEKYRRLSREFLQKSIREGNVTLNHRATKPSQLLRLRDKVYVLSTKGSEPEVDFGYEILHEDDSILVVNKPGNLPVHPSGRYFFHTLLTQLRVENGNEVDQKKEFYIVHRLDRETSGVLVIGKTAKAAASLVEQFGKRETRKEYLALVKGVVAEDSFVVDAPLARDPRSEIRLKMHVVETDLAGEPLYVPASEVLPARTAFAVVERLDGFTLLRCRPHTGRQHQIRVHLWHSGHPIAGDKLYGTDAGLFLRSMQEILELPVAPGLSLRRHALHAHNLGFRHPDTGEELEFSAPLPPELAELVERVRQASTGLSDRSVRPGEKDGRISP
jgi:23S rRNA pseudouridine1911/1915/1917 synthase